jgi:hypothetical protein
MSEHTEQMYYCVFDPHGDGIMKGQIKGYSFIPNPQHTCKTESE